MENPRKIRHGILAVIILLFIGNRVFNHVNAWAGVAILAIASVIAVRLVIKTNFNNNEKDS